MAHTADRFTLWGIEVFIATVEEASISAAARRLGASPATVSQQLTNLEAAVGARLLDRNARPVRLTQAGDIFRRRAQSILNEAALVRAELAQADMAALTRFRLGMIEDFDADVTPRLLSQMAGTFQDCQFLLETGASHRLFDQLDARALDLIVAADMGAGADWMEVHPLIEEPFVAAVPKGSANAIETLPLIQYTQRHHMGRQIAAHLARQNMSLAHKFELDSYHAIMAMVAERAGWTILTPLGWMRAKRFRDQVDLIPLPFEPLSRTISLNARKGILADMPGDVANRLRPLLNELVVKPAIIDLPWLADQLRIL
ncbi:LysR family transcriptional regulator [Parasulfitobacter algicola]|uniref:LysR family transcriptional regulator n=1 Tax=Parasulfitobacter algicola TaxID=2614809 RepID=A0ABX2IMN2_9RHOB|nr:LysR family transcriptional regulator [Sulfitobacter algicola]NSX54151.1 LysR family transcriptional regulator [Sulfitobacter algicola]